MSKPNNNNYNNIIKKSNTVFGGKNIINKGPSPKHTRPTVGSYHQTSLLSSSPGEVPELRPGRPDLLPTWIRKLSVAIATNHTYHKDLVEERRYDPEPPEVRGDTNPSKLNFFDKELIKIRLQHREKKIREAEDAKREIFDFIWARLSLESQEWIRRQNPVIDRNDPLKLIETIELTHSISDFTGSSMKDRTSATKYYNELSQGSRETIYEFKLRFYSAVRGMKVSGSTIPSVADQVAHFLDKLDKRKYGHLLEDIYNGVLAEPKTVEEAAKLAEFRFEFTPSGGMQHPGRAASAAFVASERKKEFRTRNFRPRSCILCGEEDHFVFKCPHAAEAKEIIIKNKNKSPDNKISKTSQDNNHKKSKKSAYMASVAEEVNEEDELGDGTQFYGYMARKINRDENSEDDYDEELPDFDGDGSNKYEILLDTQATHHIFKDIELLTNVRDLEENITFNGISGDVRVNQCGVLPYFGHVYYHEHSPVNILSFSIVEDEFDIEYHPCRKMTVKLPNNAELQFFRINNGMYVASGTQLLKSLTEKRQRGPPGPYRAFIMTVEQHEALYSKREVERAKRARDFLRIAGYPSVQDAIRMVNAGAVKDLDITSKDIHRANNIYGTEIAVAKGKSKERKSKTFAERYEIGSSVPVQSEQILFADLASIEGYTFLVTITSPLGLWMISCIGEKGTKSLNKEFQTILMRYSSRGFIIKKVITDSEANFLSLSSMFEHHGIILDPAGPKKHVHKAEVSIRILKERVRAILHSLPYMLPRKLIPFLVLFAAARLNSQPCNTRHDPTPPREIFLNRKASMKLDFKIGFGELCLVENVSEQKNSMEPRVREALSLHPHTNGQGSFYFFMLDTQEIVVRDNWQGPIPFTTSIIERINAITNAGEKQIVDAAEKKQDKKKAKLSYKPTQYSSPMTIIKDTDDTTQELIVMNNYIDRNSIPTVVNEESVEENTVHNENSESVDEENTEETTQEADPQRDDPGTDYRGDPDDGDHDQNDIEKELENENENDGDEVIEDEADVQNANIVPEDNHQEEEEVFNRPPPEPPPKLSNRYNTRNRGEKHVKTYVSVSKDHYCFQISIRKAQALFGAETDKAVDAEFQQMEEKEVWEPVRVSTLTRAQRQSIIRSFVFLKDKYDANGNFEKLKARLVAGGNGQDPTLYPNKSSPTASLQSLFMIALTAAQEKRHVVTADIAGAYLNASMKDSEVFMKLDPVMTQILIKKHKKYKNYLNPDGTLVVKLKKALYGCVESARLWYNHLANVLSDFGFSTNPYDKCVFNKIYTDKRSIMQMTVLVYVDDLMITCVDKRKIDEFIQYLKDRFKTVTDKYGETHSFLGMNFNFTHDGKVDITMNGFIDDVLKATNTQKFAKTPANENLFKLADNELQRPLNKDQAKEFHSIVAKLLYLAKRVRPDILTAISFLTTRVKAPDGYDDQKLKRVLNYLNNTRTMGITLEKHFDMPVAYIDASYATHPDYKSHSGMYITFGKGPILTASSKQKVNSKSSTEAEIIALSDKLGDVLWVREFWLSQNTYKNSSNDDNPKNNPNNNPNKKQCIIFQDNMSAITLMEKDKIDNGEIQLKYKNTQDMIADLFTKPLQGKVFCHLRNLSLNCKQTETPVNTKTT